MGIKISGVTNLIAQLSQVGERAERGVSDELKKGAEDIAKLARAYAPVDEGDLERAIKAESDRSGVRGRVQAYVYVDGSSYSENAGSVDKYAERMHEGMYQLGPLSREKEQATGKKVGRKFLERATDELRPSIFKRLQERVKRSIG